MNVLNIGDLVAVVDAGTGQLVGLKAADGLTINLTGVTKQRGSVDVFVQGQSVERGEGKSMSGAAATFSDSTTGTADPVAPAVTKLASAWPSLASLLARRGYRVKFHNHALGSMSLVRHAVGQTSNRGSSGQGANSGAMYRKRVTSGGGDPADYGTVTAAGGRVFRALTGRGRWVRYSSDTPLVISGSGVQQLDYYKEETSAPSTGGTDPNWAGAVNLGDTVTDGGITWELVALSAAGMPGNAGILARGQLGFDPLGVHAGIAAGIAASKADQRIVLMSNCQADTWNANPAIDATYKGWYKSALKSSAAAHIANGATAVYIGLSSYMPDMANGVTVYDLLTEAVNEAVAELAATYPGKVYAGLNMYRHFGLNPPVQTDRVHLIDDAMPDMAAGWDAMLKAGTLP